MTTPTPKAGWYFRRLPWVLFWPEILLTRSRWITFQTFVPFHLIADAGRIPSASGQRESAANRRLETHGGKPKGGCGTECKRSPRQRLIRGRFLCFGHLMRVRPKEHASMSSSSQVTPNTPDVLVRNEGTVFLFCPLTSRGKQWIEEHVQPDAPVVWEHLGRRAPFRVGSRPRAEGC